MNICVMRGCSYHDFTMEMKCAAEDDETVQEQQIRIESFFSKDKAKIMLLRRAGGRWTAGWRGAGGVILKARH